MSIHHDINELNIVRFSLFGQCNVTMLKCTRYSNRVAYKSTTTLEWGVACARVLQLGVPCLHVCISSELLPAATPREISFRWYTPHVVVVSLLNNHAQKISLVLLYVTGMQFVDYVHFGYLVFFVVFFSSPDFAKYVNVLRCFETRALPFDTKGFFLKWLNRSLHVKAHFGIGDHRTWPQKWCLATEAAGFRVIVLTLSFLVLLSLQLSSFPNHFCALFSLLFFLIRRRSFVDLHKG